MADNASTYFNKIKRLFFNKNFQKSQHSSLIKFDQLEFKLKQQNTNIKLRVYIEKNIE